MKLIGKTLLASFALLAGCASHPITSRTATEPLTEPTEVDQAAGDPHHADAVLEASAAVKAALVDEDPRNVGDYVTYTFSGSYRKTPLKLTQRVASRADGTITIDYTFAEKEKTETMRVTVGTTRRTRGTIYGVSRIGADGAALPATIADYEARMAATAAIADENEALVNQMHTTIRVGDADIVATRSTYKVRVGTKDATLETTESDMFAWGDLGGRIVTSDGKVFFQAQVVDAGVASSARASLE